MTDYLNPYEYKEVNAGDTLYDTTLMGNILLFVSSGKLRISNNNAAPVAEVEEGYFVLLPAGKFYTVTAATSAHTIIMHAGDLSEMITENPEWNPEKLVILPIFPPMIRTISLIEAYQKKKQNNLN